MRNKTLKFIAIMASAALVWMGVECISAGVHKCISLNSHFSQTSNVLRPTSHAARVLASIVIRPSSIVTQASHVPHPTSYVTRVCTIDVLRPTSYVTCVFTTYGLRPLARDEKPISLSAEKEKIVRSMYMSQFNETTRSAVIHLLDNKKFVAAISSSGILAPYARLICDFFWLVSRRVYDLGTQDKVTFVARTLEGILTDDIFLAAVKNGIVNNARFKRLISSIADAPIREPLFTADAMRTLTILWTDRNFLEGWADNSINDEQIELVFGFISPIKQEEKRGEKRCYSISIRLLTSLMTDDVFISALGDGTITDARFKEILGYAGYDLFSGGISIGHRNSDGFKALLTSKFFLDAVREGRVTGAQFDDILYYMGSQSSHFAENRAPALCVGLAEQLTDRDFLSALNPDGTGGGPYTHNLTTLLEACFANQLRDLLKNWLLPDSIRIDLATKDFSPFARLGVMMAFFPSDVHEVLGRIEKAGRLDVNTLDPLVHPFAASWSDMRQLYQGLERFKPVSNIPLEVRKATQPVVPGQTSTVSELLPGKGRVFWLGRRLKREGATASIKFMEARENLPHCAEEANQSARVFGGVVSQNPIRKIPLSELRRYCAGPDLTKLDCGDGYALCFVDDPKDNMYYAYAHPDADRPLIESGDIKTEDACLTEEDAIGLFDRLGQLFGEEGIAQVDGFSLFHSETADRTIPYSVNHVPAGCISDVPKSTRYANYRKKGHVADFNPHHEKFIPEAGLNPIEMMDVARVQLFSLIVFIAERFESQEQLEKKTCQADSKALEAKWNQALMNVLDKGVPKYFSRVFSKPIHLGDIDYASFAEDILFHYRHKQTDSQGNMVDLGHGNGPLSIHRALDLCDYLGLKAAQHMISGNRQTPAAGTHALPRGDEQVADQAVLRPLAMAEKNNNSTSSDVIARFSNMRFPLYEIPVRMRMPGDFPDGWDPRVAHVVSVSGPPVVLWGPGVRPDKAIAPKMTRIIEFIGEARGRLKFKEFQQELARGGGHATKQQLDAARQQIRAAAVQAISNVFRSITIRVIKSDPAHSPALVLDTSKQECLFADYEPSGKVFTLRQDAFDDLTDQEITELFYYPIVFTTMAQQSSFSKISRLPHQQVYGFILETIKTLATECMDMFNIDSSGRTPLTARAERELLPPYYNSGSKNGIMLNAAGADLSPAQAIPMAGGAMPGILHVAPPLVSEAQAREALVASGCWQRQPLAREVFGRSHTVNLGNERLICLASERFGYINASLRFKGNAYCDELGEVRHPSMARYFGGGAPSFMMGIDNFGRTIQIPHPGQPLGSIRLSGALNEIAMSKKFWDAGFIVSYPLGFIERKEPGFLFDGEPTGAILQAMPVNSGRRLYKEFELLIQAITGAARKNDIRKAERAVAAMGDLIEKFAQYLRAIHSAGFIHGYPHTNNFSVLDLKNFLFMTHDLDNAREKKNMSLDEAMARQINDIAVAFNSMISIIGDGNITVYNRLAARMGMASIQKRFSRGYFGETLAGELDAQYQSAGQFREFMLGSPTQQPVSWIDDLLVRVMKKILEPEALAPFSVTAEQLRRAPPNPERRIIGCEIGINEMARLMEGAMGFSVALINEEAQDVLSPAGPVTVISIQQAVREMLKGDQTSGYVPFMSRWGQRLTARGSNLHARMVRDEREVQARYQRQTQAAAQSAKDDSRGSASALSAI